MKNDTFEKWHFWKSVSYCVQKNLYHAAREHKIKISRCILFDQFLMKNDPIENDTFEKWPKNTDGLGKSSKYLEDM